MSKMFAPSQLMLLASLALLPGCADWEQHAQDSLPPPLPLYATKQITVAPTRSVYAVTYSDGNVQPSEDEIAYLDNFLDTTIHDSNRLVLVEQPGNRAGRLAQERSATLVRMLTHSHYRVQPFTAAEPVSGQIQVAVDHLLAQTPDCPNWDFNPNFSFGSQALPNHGCADHSNLAAMVANPRDLVVGAVPSAPMGHPPLRGETNYRNDQIRPLEDAGSVTSGG